MSKRWTDADSQRLRELVAEKKWRDQDMAEIIGMSESAIRFWRHKLGLRSYNYWTAQDDETLRMLVEQKFSDRTIATMIGFSMKAVHEHRRALGLKACGKSGSAPGWKQKRRARQAIARWNKQRWQDPEYRARMEQLLAEWRKVSQAKRFRRPPAKTPDGRLYNKLRREVGFQAARQEMARGGTIDRGTAHAQA